MPQHRKPGGSARRSLALVEDDAGVRRSLQLVLRGHGYDVRAYARGDQMLADPLARHCSCLITDYRLEGIDGIAVLHGLRACGWHAPAILITGHATDALAETAQQAGFTAVLEKPLRNHLLVQLIARSAAAAG
ncbi:response regulator [Sphingomonas sp. ac-8]|uniref:response regulator n=1 Tax=Sphingomonas sp. ac-8 TaxID=3242977 RepID=UPI003A81136B